ncbi:MAG TPA: winged helix-turn-helix domain-containing protein [Stenotrophomonas sp.]
MTEILLVEVDDCLSNAMARYLRDNGYDPSIEKDLSRAPDTILATQPAAVLIDLTPPSRNGFDVCRAVRPHYSGLICMISGHCEDVDQILALELGADDYIAKPISPRVLLARLRALLRRRDEAANCPMCFGELLIDVSAREVTVGGKRVELTTAEFDLLVVLASHAGQVLEREALLRALRGIDFDGTDRSIDARVSRLRRKLGDGPEPHHIKTVRNRGYLFSRSGWN